jgi:hypothetical protein
MTVESGEKGRLTGINLNKEAVELMNAVKEAYEEKLLDQGIPLDLSRTQVVMMALKNERKRLEGEVGRSFLEGEDSRGRNREAGERENWRSARRGSREAPSN